MFIKHFWGKFQSRLFVFSFARAFWCPWRWNRWNSWRDNLSPGLKGDDGGGSFPAALGGKGGGRAGLIERQCLECRCGVFYSQCMLITWQPDDSSARCVILGGWLEWPLIVKCTLMIPVPEYFMLSTGFLRRSWEKWLWVKLPVLRKMLVMIKWKTKNSPNL